VDNVTDLQLLLRSHHPLLVVPVSDEERFVDIVRTAAAATHLDMWVWTVTRGLARDGLEAMYGTKQLQTALDFIGERDGPGVYMLADVHPQLTDPVIVRRIKEIATSLGVGSTIIITGPGIETPPELESMAHSWRLRPPDRNELRDLVARTLRDLADRGFLVAVGPQHVDGIVTSISGLTIHQAERIVQGMALDDGTIDEDDLPQIARAKADILSEDGIVELVEADTGTLDDVGGLDTLKNWLSVRREAMLRESGERLDPPRGVLLTGVPGAGKSFVAKTLARTWQRPLVLLDPAHLYSKYLGESEQRLRRALETVDAMAPVVLWIDEIEKGFARTGDGDGGASARILGTLLRWMQERTTDVFVVATANDVTALPPELARKGRFDEVFFVDVPGDAARREILESHLEHRAIDKGTLDLSALVDETTGFTGAEIETAIVAALYASVAADTAVTQSSLMAEIESTIPITVSRREEITRLRTWADERALRA